MDGRSHTLTRKLVPSKRYDLRASTSGRVPVVSLLLPALNFYCELVNIDWGNTLCGYQKIHITATSAFLMKTFVIARLEFLNVYFLLILLSSE